MNGWDKAGREGVRHGNDYCVDNKIGTDSDSGSYGDGCAKTYV